MLVCAGSVTAQQAELPRIVEAAQDTERVRAVEHSDAYYTRLAIHRFGSYLELPLFTAQYLLGQQLIKGNADSWVRPTHLVVAGTLGTLFTVNTVTGVWNLVEAREDPHPTKRYLHAGLMLAASAGFAYTGLVTARDAGELGEHADRHRTSALLSISSATAGTLVMWLWKDPD